MTRREFFNVAKKENLKHILGALYGFKEGVEETSRRSMDEVCKSFRKRRQKAKRNVL